MRPWEGHGTAQCRGALADDACTVAFDEVRSVQCRTDYHRPVTLRLGLRAHNNAAVERSYRLRIGPHGLHSSNMSAIVQQ